MATEKVSINDFYVSIQAVLENACEHGWGVLFAEKTAREAVEEWMEEKERDRKRKR